MINLKPSHPLPSGQISTRFVSLDFARGIAIIVMLFLHIIQRTLDIEALLNTINDQAIINLFALVLIPFFGGLAGFFLIVSSASNMISMFKHLKKGRSIGSLVLKQVISGFILLVVAMLIEGLIGYQGLIGVFARSLDDPSATEWTVMLWRWNFFETIHTIAWCVIINGCIQGLLSLKDNWKNTKKLITSYIILAIVVVGLTQPIWSLVEYLIPGYPFGTFPENDHQLYMPWIGTESFWEIFRAPFLNMLCAPMEPLFPYLAISFVGSIFGIVLSKPKKKISQKFPRRAFLVGFIMFLAGLVGLVIIVIKIINGSPDFDTGFDRFVELYMVFPNHRAWAHDYASFVPPFSWLGQFLAVNGFSIMLIAFLFRFVEFRGISENFANQTKIVRRFGTVALSNYNNQWMYFVVFFFTSWISTGVPYQLQKWWATFLTIGLTYLLFGLILFFWEKINYFLSLEWAIRTITNNVVPARRQSFDASVKWWQRGLIDVQNNFYNVKWINLTQESTIEEQKGSLEIEHEDKQRERIELSDQQKEKIMHKKSVNDSQFALILSIIGSCSIIFNIVSFIVFPLSIYARKQEGKNKQNTISLYLSAISVGLFIAFIIVIMVFPIGILNIF